MSTATQSPPAESERVRHRARVRARAAEIVDSPVAPRTFRHETGSRLRAPERRRLHAPRIRAVRRDRPRGWKRWAAVAVLIGQGAILGVLLIAPQFRVATVSVDGANLLTQTAVLDAAAIPHQSIFTIDGNAARQRLLAMPWIRSATVTTELPNRIHVTIVEWSPVLRLYRNATTTLLADSGASINSAAARPDLVKRIPMLVDERAGATAMPDKALVQSLDSTSTRFPAIFGTTVAAYEWRSDGVFVIWSASGWSAVLGHLDSAAEVAGIPAQLTALAALKGPLDMVHPAFGYVDLENPATPAVGGKPGLPAAVTAALTAPTAPSTGPLRDGDTGLRAVTAHTTTPTAAATPAAQAAPATAAAKPAAPPAGPTPTPYTIYIQPPPAH